MRRLLVFVSFLIAFSKFSFGQTIRDAFKALPLELTPHLSLSDKDSILSRDNNFTLEKETVWVSSFFCEDSFCSEFVGLNHSQLFYVIKSSGDAFVVDLQVYSKKGGSSLIVYAKYDPDFPFSESNELLAFDFINGVLIKSLSFQLPPIIEPEDFYKDSIFSDSVKAALKHPAVLGYNLKPNVIEYYIESRKIIDAGQDNSGGLIYAWYTVIKEPTKCKIVYAWNGKTFEKVK